MKEIKTNTPTKYFASIPSPPANDNADITEAGKGDCGYTHECKAPELNPGAEVSSEEQVIC